MKITKNKIVAISIIAVILTAAFFGGGHYSRNTPPVSPSTDIEMNASRIPDSERPDSLLSPPVVSDASAAPFDVPDSAKETEAPSASLTEQSSDPDIPPGITEKPSEPPADKTTEQTSEKSAQINDPNGMVIDPETGKDKYLTDPVPEGKPVPVEPQDVVVGDKAYTCTLSVRCDTILDNMSKLDPNKAELVPEDGVILAPVIVTFYEGESVFNVLVREMKKHKIHMEFENTPIYNSAYIEGIHNLYEFDCGELSGWMYKVNGWFPNYGCSRYPLQDGDVIEWVYTCDLGRDVGDNSMTG